MNTIVNITGLTLKLSNVNDENVIKKIKKKEYKKKYYILNKEKILKQQKSYFILNKEKMYKRAKEYYQKNKEKRINQIVSYQKNRTKLDFNFKLRFNLRTRIRKALKGKCKSSNTINLIGCSIEKLWKHLEKSFKPGMTRENHGKWHIDHIKPCSSFDLTKPEEQAKCFHYTNLQPLWASENLAKGSKIS